MPTAVMVDAAFFLRRFPKIWPNVDRTPLEVVRKLQSTALSHLTQRIAGLDLRRDLYRIFVYDCPPVDKKAHYPVSKKAIDFGKSDEAVFRLGLHAELVKLRKVALRLGRLSDQSDWRLHPKAVKDLLSSKRTVADLTDKDFKYDVTQKGVDIRIGIDICSLTLKQQVDQIVLISGDADFVPAAKLARREGVDFILDPMWSVIGLDLEEHIDGLRSTCPRPSGTPPELTEAVEKAALPDLSESD